MQAIGLTVLMAKAGLAIPAAHPARLPPFSAVLADIGDEQSLTSSLSTFSGHLHQIQARPECALCLYSLLEGNTACAGPADDDWLMHCVKLLVSPA